MSSWHAVRCSASSGTTTLRLCKAGSCITLLAARTKTLHFGSRYRDAAWTRFISLISFVPSALQSFSLNGPVFQPEAVWCCRLQVLCSVEPSRALSFVEVFISLGEIVRLSWWLPGYVPASPPAPEPGLSPDVCLGSVLSTGWGDICHIGREPMSLSPRHQGHNMEQPGCAASSGKAELDDSKSITEKWFLLAFPLALCQRSLRDLFPGYPLTLFCCCSLPIHPLLFALQGAVSCRSPTFYYIFWWGTPVQCSFPVQYHAPSLLWLSLKIASYHLHCHFTSISSAFHQLTILKSFSLLEIINAHSFLTAVSFASYFWGFFFRSITIFSTRYANKHDNKLFSSLLMTIRSPCCQMNETWCWADFSWIH